MRLLGSLLMLALAQNAEPDWRKATALNGVDFTGLTPAQRQLALTAMRDGTCGCGCAMKIAECRVKDPKCGESSALAQFVLREVKAGRSAEAIKKALFDKAVFGDPVKLNHTGAPSRGPENARFVLTVFSDFQCPYCRTAARKVDELAKLVPELRIVFKQYPLDIHSEAALAAEASLAAHAQGKFWPFHDKLFAYRAPLNRGLFRTWAKEFGLDVAKFDAALDKGAYRAQVEKDSKEGDAAGVSGTPTFYLNGRKYRGAMEPALVKQLLDQMAAGQ